MAVRKQNKVEPPVFQHIGDRVRAAPERRRYDRLSVSDELLILWGMCQGWSVRKTAAALPASPSTVKKYRHRFYEEPEQLFQLPVLRGVGDGHQCAFCGEVRKGMTAAMKHCLSHFYYPHLIRQLDLDEFEKPI